MNQQRHDFPQFGTVHESHVEEDDDDDDQIIELSSTRKRWEQLHGIKTTGVARRSDVIDVLKMNDIDDDNDDDDEIIVMTTTKPIQFASQPPFWTVRQNLAKAMNNIESWYRKESPSLMVHALVLISLMTVLFLSWKLVYGSHHDVNNNNNKKTKNDCSSILPKDSIKDILHGGIKSPQTDGQVATYSSSNLKKIDDSGTETCGAVSDIQSTSSIFVATTTTTKTAITQVETTTVVVDSGNNRVDEMTTVDQALEQHTESSLQNLHPSPSQTADNHDQITVHSDNHHHHNNHRLQIQEKLQQQQKLRLARQLIQDIQLVQTILEEQSLDPSLAPQIAVTIQSTQHIVESQRELEYQRALLENHNRQLDRRLLEQHHQDRIKAVRYDPNWKEKLDDIRNKCWTFPGSIIRLMWDVFWIYQLIHGLIAPVFVRFYCCSSEQFYYHREGISCLLDDTPPFWNAFVLDMAGSLLAKMCNCCPSQRLVHDEGYHSSSSSSSLSSMMTVLMGSIFGNGITSTPTVTSSPYLPTTLIVVVKTLFHGLPTMEQLSCYGYCIITGSIFLISTMLLHQGFRALSLPTFFHHILNLISIITFYGPHRVLDSIFVAYNNRNYYGVDVYSPRGHNSNVVDTTTTTISSIVAVLLIIIVLPVASWTRTRHVYRQVVRDVTQSSCFEETIQRSQRRLERTIWELTLWKYSILMVYSAMILWQETLSMVPIVQ
jgi:hypothetical protein